MNEAGYRTRRGGRFSDTTVARLLDDPTAKGLHRANYTQNPNGSKKWGYKPEDEWIFSEVEPIMSAELWDECQAISTEQKKTRKKPAKKTVHLFAGTMYCECGKRMYVPSKSQKYTCPACRNKMPIDDMEHIFIEQLKGFLLSPSEVENYLTEANATIQEREDTLNRLSKQFDETKRQMDSLFQLYQDGQIPTEGFKERYTPIQNRQKELERQTAEAEAQLDLLKVESLSSDLRSIGGTFRLTDGHVRIDGQRCSEASGALHSDTLSIAAEQFGREFSDLTGALGCENGAFDIALSGDGPSGDSVNIDAAATLQGAATINVVVNTADRDIEMLLANAGFSREEGSWTYRRDAVAGGAGTP